LFSRQLILDYYLMEYNILQFGRYRSW